MMTVISVENLSKTYRLGQIGTGTFANDLKLWWAKTRGKPNPLLKVGETDHSNQDGEDLWALRDVSFTVKQGEVLGIIGKNGAGKSTLLKILSRVTAPTSGKIKVKGRIASLLEVGTGFHPELTGRENIYLNGAILGMDRYEINRKFAEIVDFAEVEKFIDTPVKRYSSGMYVRLAFAVAAHLDPEILVVDEVLAVGDAEFQKKCLGKMGDVAKEGRTVLFVSHNMGAISRLCGRSILLDKGRIKINGTTQSIISEYLANKVTLEGQRVWENGVSNPGVTELKILSVSIQNNEGKISTNLDVRKSFWVEITYKLLEPHSMYRVGFIIQTIDGVRILTAYDTDNANALITRKSGENISRCKVPGKLLNSGRYVLSVNAGIPKVRNLSFVEAALSFNINYIGGNLAVHAMKRSGIIYPDFFWEFDKK